MRMMQTLALGATALLVLAGGRDDPGILFELDRERYELTVQDLAAGTPGPRLRVAIGSPAHPTPVGRFALGHVVLNPGWEPGPHARSAGARPSPPSAAGPLGVAKIPFAGGGAVALHGGGHPLLLGKSVSLGCVRATDEDLVALLEWLDQREALGGRRAGASGEVHRRFRRPARITVR